MDRRELEEMVLKMFKKATPELKETMYERLILKLSFDDLKSILSSEVLR